MHAIISSPMEDFPEFLRLVRDVLANLYAPASLETNPLAGVFPIPPESKASLGENLRQIVLNVIEWLKPPGREFSSNNPEWRSYIILSKRYIEGESFQDLQSRLSLSERQLRRAHSQAVHAVASYLWSQVSDQGPSTGEKNPEKEMISHSFSISNQPLNLAEVIDGVKNVFLPRLRVENAVLAVDVVRTLPNIFTDRIILRQILFNILNFALDEKAGGDIQITSETLVNTLKLVIQFQVEEVDELNSGSHLQVILKTAFDWAHRIHTPLEAEYIVDQGVPYVRLTLLFPRADSSCVLVVDDQITAIRLYQRYLAKTSVQVIGVQEADQVIIEAGKLQPSVIILDVMMPDMDGWEILQLLQSDPRTKHIPVVMCSVWDEPELAISLGAAGFLKKPVTQKDFITAINRWIPLDKQV